MKKTLLIYLLGLLCSSSLYSQSVTTVLQEWSTVEGTQNFFQRNVVKTDGDYTYIVGATVNVAGNYDILIAKYGNKGEALWKTQINGLANYHDFATALFISDSGYVYVTGAITNDTVNLFSDIIILKLDGSDGSTIWSQTYDGAGYYDSGTDIKVLNGDVYVAGSGFNSSIDLDYIALKYDASGVQQWANSYDYNALNDTPVKCIVSSKDNMLVLGAAQSTSTDYDAVTVEFDLATGSINNTGINTGGTSGVDKVNDIAVDWQGNIFVVGGIPTVSDGYDFYLAKLDSNLVLQWEATFDEYSGDNVLNSVAVDSVGFIYVTGYSVDAPENRCVTIKYDQAGTKQDEVTHVAPYGKDVQGNSILVDLGGKYITVAGYTSTENNHKDFYTVRYDEFFDEIWSITADGNDHLDDQATAMAFDDEGDIVVTGQSKKYDGSYEYKTVKYVQKQIITPTDYYSESPSNNFSYYENRGQLLNTNDTLIPNVKYYTNNTSPAYYIGNNNFSFVFAHVDTVAATTDTLQRIDLGFTGAKVNPDAKVYAMEEQKDYISYFLGHIPKGVTGIHSNKRLVTTELYEKIDLEYSSNQNGLKLYFIIKPGGDPTQINMEFTGASSFNLNGTTNELTINSLIGNTKFKRPTVYQINGSNVVSSITGWTPAWATNGASNKYKFSLGSFDPDKTLIIEVDMGNSTTAHSPVNNLDWSTYYGGGGEEFYDVKTDNLGYIYVTGEVTGSNFPTLDGIQTLPGGSVPTSDMIILKFNPDGSRFWATYYGGSESDLGNSIGTDNAGNVYVVGYAGDNFPVQDANTTSSTDFYQYTFGGGYDAAIVKLDPAGRQKLWATYYGGIGNDYAYSLAFDQFENIYIVGEAPTISTLTLYSQTGGYNSTQGDGLIMKFKLDATPLWITRFGGAAGTCPITGVCTDVNGNLYIGGTVSSGSGFPIQNNGANGTYGGGTGDGFVTKFGNHTAHNSLSWSTYFGGTGFEKVNKIACDLNSNIYIAGFTNSPNTSFPLVDPVSGSDYYQGTYGGGTYDGFISKINTTGSLIWSTYHGGSNDERLTNVNLDTHGNIYVLGVSSAGAIPFPSTNLSGGYAQSYNGLDDSYIVAFNSSLEEVWGTYYGGAAVERPYGIATYSDQKLYTVGGTGSDASSFPIVNWSGAYNQSTYPNNYNAYLAGFDLTPVIVISTNDLTSEDFDFNVFPNPSNDIVNISVNSLKKADLKISILNTLGQEIINEDLGSVSGNFEKQYMLNELPAGVYLIIVNIDNSISSKRIIIQ